MEETREGRLGLAILLACPACTGGFFLAIGSVFGATAFALRGFAALALVTLVGGLWARNAWQRRNEDKGCPMPAQESAVQVAREKAAPA